MDDNGSGARGGAAAVSSARCELGLIEYTQPAAVGLAANYLGAGACLFLGRGGVFPLNESNQF